MQQQPQVFAVNVFLHVCEQFDDVTPNVSEVGFERRDDADQARLERAELVGEAVSRFAGRFEGVFEGPDKDAFQPAARGDSKR